MNIKTLRELLKITQKELALKIGVSTRTISRWENGEYKPSRLAKNKLDQLIKKNLKIG